MTGESDDLSLYFHLDRALAQDRHTFHFHVLLTDGEARGFQSAHAGGRDESVLDALSVSFCLPPVGNLNQQVRDGGTGFGFICAIGKAVFGSSTFPEQVKGKVFGADPGSISSPPSDAQSAKIVNDGITAFPCPSGCDCNFVFHHTFGNEISGVAHSLYGTPNVLKIWANNGTGWTEGPTQPFKGVTASSTECGGAASFPITLLNTSKTYLLATCIPTAGTTVELHRVAEQCCGADQAWESCPKQHPGTKWKLWISSRGGKPYGVLALHKLEGTQFSAPAIWRCRNWNLGETNCLTLDCPSDLPGSAEPMTVSLA